MKLSFERVLAILVCVYLFVAIPFFIMDQGQKEECAEICGSIPGGFDIVVRATGLFELESCTCLSSVTRELIIIEMEAEKND